MCSATTANGTERQTVMISTKEWESLCDKCGLCCGGCKYFEPFWMLCTVYPDRFEKAPWCYKMTPDTVRHLYSIKALPDSCAYVHVEGLTNDDQD
jgi:uncharacterized cysteine cluster protein YcgN (CxxCxxCC family)